MKHWDALALVANGEEQKAEAPVARRTGGWRGRHQAGASTKLFSDSQEGNIEPAWGGRGAGRARHRVKFT